MFDKIFDKSMKSHGWMVLGAILLTVGGIFSVQRLRVDLFPPLNFPILNIILEVPGYSSYEMERQVTIPVESAAGGVLGVKQLRSTSSTGISMISVEFEWGTDMLMARQLLTESLGSVKAQLPSSAGISIENLSASLSMIEGYSLSGQEDPVKMRDLAVFDLKPRLQRIPGVYKVIVMGGATEEYSVTPNLHSLVKYDLTLENLRDGILANNSLSSPGVLNAHAQEWIVQSNGQFKDVDEVKSSVISVKSGTAIHLSDVAAIERGVRYERGDTSEAGKKAVFIQIVKQPAFDTGEVTKLIANEVERFKKTLPPSMKIVNFYDQNQLVQDSVGSVMESVWIGGVLVVFILFLFLRNIRSTLIATLSIPISVVTALILMKLFGTDLNIMSLGGLAIGTGIIVDDTIVVMENIFRWLSLPDAHTRTPFESIKRATREVLHPVVLSTMTNIGIFLPMILIDGFAGRLFEPVSITVTLALLASLAVAVLIIPNLSGLWLSHTKEVEEDHENRLQKLYGKILNKVLHDPKRTLIFGAAPLFIVFFLVRGLSVEFLPALDEGAILLQTIMPQGTSLQESIRVNQKIEAWIAKVPGVESAVRRTGHAPGAEDTDSVNHSDITVKLVEKSKRPVSISRFIETLKAKTDQLPSIQVNYLMPLTDKINDALGGIPADIGVDFFGADLEKLHTYADAALKAVTGVKGLEDIRPPEGQGVPSYQVVTDKAAAGKLGITTSSITNVLQAFSSGLDATSVKELQKEIPVTLHLSDPSATVSLDSLREIPLRTNGGNMIPLDQVTKFEWNEIPSEINHEQLTRKITLTASIKGRTSDSVASDLTKILDGLNFEPGYHWAFSGKYKTERKALNNLFFVFLLAIMTVATFLWIGFKNVMEVILILLTIPFAAVGAILGLWVFGQSLNVSSMIGAIMLVGIVVRNGIMLLDYMNILIRQGLPLEVAIQTSAKKRLRPILMTASVTILGLLPLALGLGSGAELQRPLAIAVICGLISSTALTLILLPCATELILRKKHASSNH